MRWLTTDSVSVGAPASVAPAHPQPGGGPSPRPDWGGTPWLSRARATASHASSPLSASGHPTGSGTRVQPRECCALIAHDTPQVAEISTLKYKGTKLQFQSQVNMRR